MVMAGTSGQLLGFGWGLRFFSSRNQNSHDYHCPNAYDYPDQQSCLHLNSPFPLGWQSEALSEIQSDCQCFMVNW